MKRIIFYIIFGISGVSLLLCLSLFRPAFVATAAEQAQKAASPALSPLLSKPLTPLNAARVEKELQDARRQALDQKEAALAAKELELKKLSEKLDAQLKSLESAKKQQEEANRAKAAANKKEQEEKLQKMVKLFKTMKGEQAGKLMDSLPEHQALTVLGRLDTKTVVKLSPYLNQPRVIKWISENIGNSNP